jgi:hypothetical protein
VHEATGRITPLIQLDFSLQSKEQGTRIGDGIKWSFVIFTMRHAPSRELAVVTTGPKNLRARSALAP